ncbi:MAG: hypothetical protein MZV49_25450 [Rhodopseudomonas palustris]|nr:hypothetical protein [Rhodopseudomonas palustris]
MRYLSLTIASLTSFNPLDSRFASPIFIPQAALVLTVAEKPPFVEIFHARLPAALTYAIVVRPLFVVLGLLGMRSVTAIQFQHENGGRYTSREWHDTRVIAYWLGAQAWGGTSGVQQLSCAGWLCIPGMWRYHSPAAGPIIPTQGSAVIPLETYLPSLFERGEGVLYCLDRAE